MKVLKVNSKKKVDKDKVCVVEKSGALYFYYPEFGFQNISGHKLKNHRDGSFSIKNEINISKLEAGERFEVTGVIKKSKWIKK